jgi:hypothetical protein
MVQSRFILNILDLLLDCDEDGKIARQQMTYLTERNYNYSGAGLFVIFSHTDDALKYRLRKKDAVLNGVKIKSPDLGIGADATLSFKDGIVDYLEIWSLDGNYPDKELEKYIMTQEWKDSPNRQIIDDK